MRVQITARHCDVPEGVRRRAEERIVRLGRYEPRLSGADVVFETERHLKRVEAVLSVDREEPVVAHGEGDEFRAALDQAVDRLSRILRRRRSQLTEHKPAGTGEGPPVGPVEA